MADTEFKVGDLIRFDHGETALCRLTTPHGGGGWIADHCMGGSLYVGKALYKPFRHVTPEERRVWRHCAWWRSDAPRALKAHFIQRGGFWGAYAHQDQSSFTGCRYSDLATAYAAFIARVKVRRNLPAPQQDFA